MAPERRRAHFPLVQVLGASSSARNFADYNLRRDARLGGALARLVAVRGPGSSIAVPLSTISSPAQASNFVAPAAGEHKPLDDVAIIIALGQRIPDHAQLIRSTARMLVVPIGERDRVDFDMAALQGPFVDAADWQSSDCPW